MKKIVEKGIKIDLHIHSVYSTAKDKEKVAENTIDNLPVLITGLIENQVEMCAITDHDNFDYSLYKKLKEEELKDNCVKKVLPGIEFSVEFIDDKVIHIVTIFDDKDDNKVKKIEDIMKNGKGKEKYNSKKGAYKKKDYFDILSDINIDFVMIAHQKKTPTSIQKPHANDVMALGKDVFNRLVFMDYFDAYEFRNKKNEIYNKAYSFENQVEENLRFITGSDCHRWKYYPYTEESENIDFKFTYIKALPSFKGLAMAVTDYHRIELENTFFNPNEKYMKEVIIDIDGEENIVPLSKGINVIIGDNSIGKSLFLNAITGYYKIDSRKKNGLYKGYEKYTNKNKLNFKNHIKEEDIFKFNQQGEIRGIFDEDGLKPDKYLENFYPNKINSLSYRKPVDLELEKFYSAIEKKFSYDKEVKNLPSFKIPKEEALEKSLTFIHNLEKKDTKELQNLVDYFNETINAIKQLIESKGILEEDKEHLKSTLVMLLDMSKKYKNKMENCKAENEKINVFNTYIKEYKSDYSRKITDEQSVFSEYLEQKELAIDGIATLIQKECSLSDYEFNVLEVPIVPEVNPVDKYKFISKLSIEKIDSDYVANVIRSVLKAGKFIKTSEITEADLKNIIKRYPSEEEISPLNVLKDKINQKLEEDFRVKNTIIEEDMDVYQEVSTGFDAQMYFTLLSGEMRDKGIYIIDQPEDHISQKAIKEKVLNQFRRMGRQRQVIMVTHNPQFIVNLDVDNVIYLSKENGKFTIQSGALEYEEEAYSILKIVADNIEGGLSTIQGRMKRYEKNI